MKAERLYFATKGMLTGMSASAARGIYAGTAPAMVEDFWKSVRSKMPEDGLLLVFHSKKGSLDLVSVFRGKAQVHPWHIDISDIMGNCPYRISPEDAAAFLNDYQVHYSIDNCLN